MAKAMYCEKCGNVYYPFFWFKKCKFCKTKMKLFPQEMVQKYKIFDESWMELSGKLGRYSNPCNVHTINEELTLCEELLARRNDFVMNELADNPMFSMELFEERVQKSRSLDRRLAESHYQERCEKFAKSLAQTHKGADQAGHVPKCPICGSPDIQRIAIGTRAVKTAAFGIAGAVDDAGKTYKCGNCGSKF